MEKEKNVEINTIPRLFWDSVKSRGEKVAMREKDLGIWQEISWFHYGEKAKLTGLALHTLGLEKGNVVSIASEGNPEWLYTCLLYTSPSPRDLYRSRMPSSA